MSKSFDMAIATKNNIEDTGQKGHRSYKYRVVLAVLIIALVILYTAAVVGGFVPEGRKIDTVNLTAIAIALVCVLILINPGIFDRLKMFEVSGFKLEMLERVREKQAEQERKLEDITLILPLLLPKEERKHLLNLAEGKTAEYKGCATLRVELRRLRTAGLIKSRPETFIGQMNDGSNLDLAKFVELTMLGERWVRRIKEIERAEMNDENNH
jgi:hypothetical protein